LPPHRSNMKTKTRSVPAFAHAPQDRHVALARERVPALVVLVNVLLRVHQVTLRMGPRQNGSALRLRAMAVRLRS
jgi:hypothetical protein